MSKEPFQFIVETSYGLFIKYSCFNFILALIAEINGPANRLLVQIGAKKGAAETRACFPVEFFLCAIFRKLNSA